MICANFRDFFCPAAKSVRCVFKENRAKIEAMSDRKSSLIKRFFTIKILKRKKFTGRKNISLKKNVC